MIDYVSITPKYKNDSHFHGKISLILYMLIRIIQTINIY
ncbi:hypothetical protein MTBBW1_720024 [Desulfamplus magnetovallimortis]|uniref:Uncharacterized protein n=1 Tax=Desulfamplus magnetovallimortis TaxID=1246637 RepID=A0A1W1HIU7_9BACT|nr:hypothetical protein MTBBW1_720024 [Desulfamplus magnetovallimortis]